ncbi:metalloendopeptidase OMA1, mitochondrial isoform X2 [Mixophyes fleayi]|uniref:metalloendopeptidase OMA1, mitochondrial isoform X2 n=1 Tax=Mixophyes fleayi TaxID=3061075 RepID=UPI003F4E0294
MEVFRHLMISKQKILSLQRLISSRMMSYRCCLHAKNTTTQSKNAKAEFYQTFVYYRPQTSSLSTRSQTGRCTSHGNQGLKNVINGKTCKSGIQSSYLFARMPETLTVPQNYTICAKNIHTSPRLNVLLPPHIWLLIKPVQKLFAIILGRSVRKWWKALPANKRQLFKENVKRNKWKLCLSAAGLGFIFILFYFTNLEESPITGRSRLLVFRKEHYDLLTTMEYESLIEEFKDTMLPKEDARYQLVEKIVDTLIACNRDLPEVSKIEWTIHIVDKPLINAFVLPNGQVFVFTGMLDAVADNHQLAFILGHELAHAILEHTAEKASVSHFLDFLFLISLTMIWAICPMDSLAIVGQWIQSKLREFMFERPYSRTLEAEADKVGLELAAKALKLRESCNCADLPSTDPRLIFELSVKHLLQTSRDRDGQVIKAELGPMRVDDRVPLASAVGAI